MGNYTHDPNHEVADTEPPPAVADDVASALDETGEAVSALERLFGTETDFGEKLKKGAKAVQAGKVAALSTGVAVGRLGGAVQRLSKAAAPLRSIMERGEPLSRKPCPGCQGSGTVCCMLNGAKALATCGLCAGQGQ